MPSRSPAPPHVLVVDDNEVNQKLAVLMLERLGYRADVAANGVAAVDSIAVTPYAAVLMDCHMPLMDGFEAAAEIRRRFPLRRLPIIAMTAGTIAEDRRRCIVAGMDDFVDKPISLKALDAALQRWTGAMDEHPQKAP